MGSLLNFGHLDGNAGVGSRWKLVEHILPNAANHAVLEPVANGVEVTGSDDLAAAVGADGVQRAQAPFRLEGHVVDPFDDGGQLVDAVFHRRAGEHEAISRRQAFDGEGGLGRPVLDALRLVKHDQFGVPAADGLEVAEELFVIDDEKAGGTARVSGLAFLRRAIDDVDGQVRERRPLASPLRFEAGRRDDQAAADAAAVPQDVTARDRLRCFSQPHVVGEQQSSGGQESVDSRALVGVKRALELLDCVANLAGPECASRGVL